MTFSYDPIIGQLGPVSEMGQLEHLELAANCLMHHDALAPVSGER